MSLIQDFLRKKSNHKLLSQILADGSNRDQLLGMKDVVIPTPEGIKIDAAKLLKYTDSDGYTKFAEEAWNRIIAGLDQILDPKANKETRDFFCGEVNATLNLLRLSYTAKEYVKVYDKEHQDTFHRAVRKDNRLP